jgi:hypothetical protein
VSSFQEKLNGGNKKNNDKKDNKKYAMKMITSKL